MMNQHVRDQCLETRGDGVVARPPRRRRRSRASAHAYHTQVRDQMDVANPFRFAHVQNLNSVDDLDDTGPCVVMAAPGMLQSGVSRRLFDKWASSERNGVVIAGYSVEGTLAKQILSEPDEVRTMDGRVQARRCTVCLLYTSPSPRDISGSRMPSSA